MTTRMTFRGVAFALTACVLLAGTVLFATPAKAQATTTIPLCEITRGLGVGMTGAEVQCLQRYLNWAHMQVAIAGPGAPSQETVYFGSLTAGAVTRWQNANAAEVLTPLGLSAGTGYWGSSSMSLYVKLVRLALALQ